MHGVDALKTLSTHHISVFNEAGIATLFSYNFKMSSITPYDSKGDLIAYVEVFHSWMDFKRVLKLVRYRANPLTLSRIAQSRHDRLPLRSIISFEQQMKLFVTHFLDAKQLKKTKQPPNDF